MNKRKIGLVNLQYIDNYGAVLLAYALQTAIERLGYEVEIIDYRKKSEVQTKDIFYYINRLIELGAGGTYRAIVRRLKGRKNLSVNISSPKKKKRFEDFRERYLKRSEVFYCQNNEKIQFYDAYVVGSDAIWKPSRISSNESDVFFLNFTLENPNCIRVAYAASFVTNDQDELIGISEKLKNLIPNFDAVSIREESSIPFAQHYFDKIIEWCIDPTLLLDRQDYDALIVKAGITDITGKDYIYLYLFEDNEEAFKMANYYSKEMNLPIVCQCQAPYKIDNLLCYSGDDGPVEFLYRIKKARLVITDSFHGTVFSILYHKDFFSFSRGTISYRMQEWLSKLDLMDNYVDKFQPDSLTSSCIDYDRIDKLIEEWRNHSMDYLMNALSESRGGGYRLPVIIVFFDGFVAAPCCESEVAA